MYAACSATMNAVSKCWPATSGTAAATPSATTPTASRPFIGRLDFGLAENSPRPVEQDGDEDREHDGVAERRGDVEARERLHEADQQAAGQRARHAAEAAEHGDDERLQDELVAHERADERERHDDRAG